MESADDVTGPINVGNPDEFTIRQLAEKIVEMVGSDAETVFKDLPVDDPMQRRPDITKARTLLNWEPRIPLETGLGHTIDYFRALVNERQDT